MISRAMSEEKLPVFRKDENVRDRLHVQDYYESRILDHIRKAELVVHNHIFTIVGKAKESRI